eukprot:6244090-Pyramimonas_sp.AAC.1
MDISVFFGDKSIDRSVSVGARSLDSSVSFGAKPIDGSVSFGPTSIDRSVSFGDTVIESSGSFKTNPLIAVCRSFYNRNPTLILRRMLPEMLFHIAVRLLCRDKFPSARTIEEHP